MAQPQNKTSTKPWILVIEKSSDTRGSLLEKLNRDKYQVLSCQSQKELQRLMAHQKFDCIIIDFAGDPVEAEKIIDQVSGKAAILAVSASLDLGFVKRIRPKVSSVLIRPVDASTLLTRVREVCESVSKKAA